MLWCEIVALSYCSLNIIWLGGDTTKMIVSPDHGMAQLDIAIFCDKDIIHAHGCMCKMIILEMLQRHDATSEYGPDLMFLKEVLFLDPQVQLLLQRMCPILIKHLNKM